MDIQTDLEWLGQQTQKGNSQINSFLQNLENKDSIINVLHTEKFYDEFENFLNNTTPIEKVKLKKQIKECKNEEEIKLVLIEHLHKDNWYDIADENVLIAISDENISTERIEQQTINNEQQTINNEQQTINNEQQATEIVSWRQEMKNAISARQELVDKLPELNRQTNEDSELYQSTKSEFEQNWIIQQLKDSNHDDNFINDYILVHTTLKELKQNENYKNINISFFEKAVKNLDNACNIPDTNFDNFSKENIAKTRTELFDTDIGNHSLREAKKVNEKLDTHKNRYNEIFALDEDKDINTQLIEKYWKFVKDDDLKTLIKKYENNELSEQDCDTLKKWLGSIKEDINNQTKDLIEEMCLIAPIQWIFACIWPDFGNNFELNKCKEINNKDWKLTITWHIDWIKFSLRHDTNNPDARLQISSLLTKIGNNKFKVWEKYEDSPFKLPTNEDIFFMATSCIEDRDVTKTEDGPTYFQTLQSTIYKKFNEILYKNAKDANNYIKDKIQWEKVSNQYVNLLWKIKWSPIIWDIESSNPKLYNFIDLMNSSNYIYSSSEKENISNCINTIQDIISTYWETDKETDKYPWLISHFLMDEKILKNTQKILKWFDVSWESIFDLLWYYKEDNSWIKTINFKQLQKDLEWKKWQESLIASMRQEDKTKKNADIDLDNAIGNIA